MPLAGVPRGGAIRETSEMSVATQVRHSQAPRAWKTQSVQRAQRDLVDFLDREVPNTLNRRLDVSGPDHCRRTLEEYLPGFQALRYELRYEFAGEVVHKALVVGPLYADREELAAAVTTETTAFGWDLEMRHDGEATAGRFRLELDGPVPRLTCRIGDGAEQLLDDALARRLRLFFQHGLRTEPVRAS